MLSRLFVAASLKSSQKVGRWRRVQAYILEIHDEINDFFGSFFSSVFNSLVKSSLGRLKKEHKEFLRMSKVPRRVSSR